MARRKRPGADLTDRQKAELLDWVQSRTRGYGRGWIFRESDHGRGMRLHETSRDGAQSDVYSAIRAAMEKGA